MHNNKCTDSENEHQMSDPPFCSNKKPKKTNENRPKSQISKTKPSRFKNNNSKHSQS